ncbi:DUF6049 family protein [Aestuariimicrobium soli]|uniref:DUF6049 family protein n=1 Tax=Aestuariimicrobium soli TaxID=2035834 RepID=UPI003EBFE182
MRSHNSAVGRLVTLLAACLVALTGVLATPLTARADDPTEVDITLTLVSPQVVPTDPKARITITGEVTNTSKVAMSGVQVSFWRSRDPIATTAELQSAAASPWDVPFGERMGVDGTEPEQNLFNITTDDDPSFAPGEKASFTVSARVDQLDLGTITPDDPTGGVRLLGVHVRATPAGGTNHTVGRARYFAPMTMPAQVKRASLVELSSAPSLLPDGSFTDTHLASELRGRLRQLIQRAGQTGATVLIDPSLYDELTAMSADGGYRLADGRTTTDGSQLAREFLQRFDALLTTAEVYRLPYGNPDLALGHQEHQPDMVVRAARALPGDHDLAHLPLAVVPARAVDASFVDYVTPLAPRLLVLRTGTGPARQQVGDLMVVRTDSRLGSGGPGPAPSNSAPQQVGRALSELLLDPSTEIVTTSDQLPTAVQQALAPITQLVGVSQLTVSPGAIAWPKAQAGAAASDDWWVRLDDTTRRLTQAADLRGNSADGAVQASVALSRACSSAFTSAQRLAYLHTLRTGIPVLAQQDVRIVSAENFVVSEPRTLLPITVVNNTDQPVAVRVVFTSENAQRISLPPTEVLTIEPHASRSYTFTVDAHTNGALTVRASLQTSGGVPVGQEHRFTLTANSLGRVGWVVIVISGVVVLAATALRIRQVRRERALAPARGTAATAPNGGDDFVTRDDLGTRPHP